MIGPAFAGARAVFLVALAATSNDPATAEAPAPADPEAMFRRGVREYDAGAYNKAIELFQAAYDLSRAPEILFDVGQAFRALGDCRRAVDAFERFVSLAKPDDPLLPRARARQEELRGCAAERSPTNVTKDAPVEPVGTVPVGAGSSSPPPAMAAARGTPEVTLQMPLSRTLTRTTCFALGGVAVAMGATGGVLALKARSAQEEVNGSYMWDDTTRRADERGRTYSDISVAALITAGASAVLAVSSCWLSWR